MLLKYGQPWVVSFFWGFVFAVRDATCFEVLKFPRSKYAPTAAMSSGSVALLKTHRLALCARSEA